MQETRRLTKCVHHLVICFALACASALVATAQQSQETPGTRGGKGVGYSKGSSEKKMNASSAVGNRRPGKAAQKRSYRTNIAFADGAPPKGKTFVTVGVTIGRGRLATDAEISNSDVAKVKGCVQWEGKKCVSRKDFVLARISDDSAVSDKEQIQMIIEYLAYLDNSGNKQSNSIGYLYVINREQYAKDDYGPPSLIFPTRKTYGGDNRVLPGKTVTMPDPERTWTISRSNYGKVQIFENYIIIVSPEPLKDLSGRELQLQENSIILDEKLVDSWVRQWGGSELRGDLEGGAGELVTQREVKSSGAVSVSKRSTGEDEDDLKQDDPPPQIIFRKVVQSRGKMLMIIRLPYKEAAAPKVSTP